MRFESSFEKNIQETTSERREKLKEGFGVVLCTKQKDGENSLLKDQINFAENINLSSVQFDLRHRTSEEVQQSKGELLKYRESHPDAVISIHGETPKSDKITGNINNNERIVNELELLEDLSGESYTVHPPSIGLKLFNELPQYDKNKLIDNYCTIFIQSIKKAIENNKKISIAIENMPVKGEEGSYGQTVNDIIYLIRKIEKGAVEQGIDPNIAHEYVGATLDVNHALTGTTDQDYKKVLKDWFEGLGDYLKVVHLYTPSEIDTKYQEKFKTSLELASIYNPKARLLMESKQNPVITQKIYEQTKTIDIS